MGTMGSQITSLTIVYSTVYSDADQRRHQSSASLAFVRGIHRWPVNSPHKWPLTQKMFPFDVILQATITLNRCIMFLYVRFRDLSTVTNTCILRKVLDMLWSICVSKWVFTKWTYVALIKADFREHAIDKCAILQNRREWSVYNGNISKEWWRVILLS